jgi:hypothetical protein
MGKSFRVYVDESGDEGLGFGHGASDWFVLAAVAGRIEHDLTDVKLVDAIRILLNKHPRKNLHFRDLKHEQRLPYCDAITESRLRTIALLIHKPSLHTPEAFRDDYRLYFYGVRYLLERVSWLCRDRRRRADPNDGSAEVVFSNRSSMSYDKLRNYLGILKKDPSVRIDWNVIKSTQVVTQTAGKQMGLQIADAVASAYFKALERNTYGHVECRYVTMLAPRAYRHRGTCLGYGVKFWPPEGQTVAEGRGDWGWTGRQP